MKQEPIRPSMLDSISGFMFFGVPHQGLAVECLVPMIKDSPNRALLESLGKNSPLLCRLQREFSDAIGTKCCQIVSFYETERSSTAQQVLCPLFPFVISSDLRLGTRWKMGNEWTKRGPG